MSDDEPKVLLDESDGEQHLTVTQRGDDGLKVMTVTPDFGLLMNFPVQFVYERQNDLVRFKTKGLTNHETRSIMVGLWMRLDEADKRDFISELAHYIDDPNAEPSEFMRLIAAAGKEDET